MFGIDSPLWVDFLAFVVAGAAIAVAGTRLAAVADELADRTGLGEALTGALLVGASTSLPGIITSIVAGAEGRPKLAVANGMGGIAAQTVFLAIADATYRRANLEHAAASVPNMMSGTLLIALIGLVTLGAASPEWTVLGVHPVTPVLFCAYLGGLALVRRASVDPQWRPRATSATVADVPDARNRTPKALWRVLATFGILAAVTGSLGWVVAEAGLSVAARSGLSDAVVGGLFTAVTTSTPELVVAVAAVRQGAVTLAVSEIIGGNAFDVLFTAAADVSYRQGSIYHAIGPDEHFVMAITTIMTALLVMGLLARERHGIGNIGFESALIAGLYVVGFSVLALGW